MPINSKIIDQIHQLTISDSEKELMTNVLHYEEEGKFRYKTGYNELIQKHLKDCDTETEPQ